MYYILQENTFNEEGFNTLIDLLERFKFDYEIVKVLPFTEEIDFKTNRKDVMCFGSVKMARIFSEQKTFDIGSFLNENHNYEVYSKFYKENLLNYDSRIVSFEDSKNIFKGGELYFIRPCEDNKLFTGKVFDKKDWDDFHEYTETSKNEKGIEANTQIQIAIPKNIFKEIRFWVVKGKVVTGSQYRLNNKTIYNSYYEEQAKDFVEDMCKLFCLADAFVMDVCLTENGWKIVECGCINCAGFYKADLSKLLIALENNF